MTVDLVNAEVLRVAPDEVLIIKLTLDEAFDDDQHQSFHEVLLDELARLGLKDRALVIDTGSGVDLQFAVVEKSG